MENGVGHGETRGANDKPRTGDKARRRRMKASIDGKRLNLSEDTSVTARGWDSPNHSTIIAGDAVYGISKTATSCSAVAPNLTPRPFTSTLKDFTFLLSVVTFDREEFFPALHFTQYPASHTDDSTEPTYFFGLRRGVTLIVLLFQPSPQRAHEEFIKATFFHSSLKAMQTLHPRLIPLHPHRIQPRPSSKATLAESSSKVIQETTTPEVIRLR
jgi:hypothetical protein